MMWRGTLSVAVVMAALLACASKVDDVGLEQPIDADAFAEDAFPSLVFRVGRLCVRGQSDWVMVVQNAHQAHPLTSPGVTLVGEQTCVLTPVGKTVLWDGHRYIATWVDLHETTTVDLERPFEPSATTPETESLAWIAWQDYCRSSSVGCIGEEDLTRLDALATSTAARERQAARLVKLEHLEDGPEKHALAQAIWSELEATTDVAESYPKEVVTAALTLGDDAARALETAVLERSGFALRWSPLARRLALAWLVDHAGVGAASDGLRARIRSGVDADPSLLGVEATAEAFLQHLAFDHHMSAAGEEIVREELEPFAGTTCESGSRWLLYVYSTKCGACKRPQRQMLEKLDQGDERFRVVSISTWGDVSPAIAERSDIEVAEMSPSLEEWFVAVRGSTVVPYFFGLVCDETQTLRMVGFGGLDDATAWDELPRDLANPQR